MSVIFVVYLSLCLSLSFFFSNFIRLLILLNLSSLFPHSLFHTTLFSCLLLLIFLLFTFFSLSCLCLYLFFFFLSLYFSLFLLSLCLSVFQPLCHSVYFYCIDFLSFFSMSLSILIYVFAAVPILSFSFSFSFSSCSQPACEPGRYCDTTCDAYFKKWMSVYHIV